MTRFAIGYTFKGKLGHTPHLPMQGGINGLAGSIPGAVAWVSVENGWPGDPERWRDIPLSELPNA